MEKVFLIEKTGYGPIYVFLHGFCQSSAYWAPVLDRLVQVGGSGLAPDLPGFGASATCEGPYTMAGLADAVVAMLAKRGLANVVLIGGSMGGVVAQEIALRHPNRIARLLLVATGGFAADPAAALAKADQIEASPWDEAAVVPIVNGFFHISPPAEKLAELRRIALCASKNAAVESTRSNARSRTFDRLSEIDIPTLVIQGRLDKARTPAHGTEMIRRLPAGQLAIIEQAGHTPQLEQPEAFWQVAAPFLLGQQ